jgi:hypothetical protein
MRSRVRQGGVAMLVLAVVVMGAAVVIVKTLNAATWKADRLRVTNEAFAKAKEALIARAVAPDNPTIPPANLRPGTLPCPDLNDDGTAELFVGNQCPNYVGRLPWRTLELPDLRDSEGERLWYVLSPSHRNHNAALPVNSNTAGQITINGASPATQVLAVLISPGRPLVRAAAPAMQQRDCPGNCNLRTNYLDVVGGIDNAAGSTGGPINLTYVAETASFNDRLLAIHADDIMPLLEKRAGREISLAMRDRYESWRAVTGRGFYPWAAPFNDPANPGLGVNGTLHGHLPVTAAPAVWSFASVSFGLGSCNGVGTPILECTSVLILGNVTARIDNVATRFLEAPTPPTVGGLQLASNYSYTLNGGAQRMDFQYSALLGVTGIRIEAPALASWAPSTSPWLVNNQWNRVATYALSQGHAITGSGACTGPNPCISIGGPADKEAIVMMTGRPLPATLPTAQTLAARTMVPAQIAQYLEAANATPADMALERNLRNTVFNDQPVVVRP